MKAAYSVATGPKPSGNAKNVCPASLGSAQQPGGLPEPLGERGGRARVPPRGWGVVNNQGAPGVRGCGQVTLVGPLLSALNSVLPAI
jgi:hypothetical protein